MKKKQEIITITNLLTFKVTKVCDVCSNKLPTCQFTIHDSGVIDSITFDICKSCLNSTIEKWK